MWISGNIALHILRDHCTTLQSRVFFTFTGNVVGFTWIWFSSSSEPSSNYFIVNYITCVFPFEFILLFFFSPIIRDSKYTRRKTSTPLIPMTKNLKSKVYPTYKSNIKTIYIQVIKWYWIVLTTSLELELGSLNPYPAIQLITGQGPAR